MALVLGVGDGDEVHIGTDIVIKFQKNLLTKNGNRVPARLMITAPKDMNIKMIRSHAKKKDK